MLRIFLHIGKRTDISQRINYFSEIPQQEVKVQRESKIVMRIPTKEDRKHIYIMFKVRKTIYSVSMH